MDIATIDARYAQLQNQTQQLTAALSGLAQKMQAAAATGDPNAREWLLDLKGIALEIKDEQGQANNLLQAMHDFVVNTLQQQAQPQVTQQAPAPGYGQQQYAAPGYAQGGYGAGGGGMLQHFLGSGFGRAVAMGAGFGIGDDIINSIF